MAKLAGQPVMSVDTRKTELVGSCANRVSDYRPKGDPQFENVQDYADRRLDKAAPYCVDDVVTNAGFISAGIACDAAKSPSPPFAPSSSL